MKESCQILYLKEKKNINVSILRKDNDLEGLNEKKR